MKYDWTIVGAGFVGCVCAERIAARGERVLLIDARDHLGGNAYDCVNEHGHTIHRYGPHVFHTNSRRVSDYLSRFTEWTRYEHRAVGLVGGRMVPIPFNLTSVEILFPCEAAAIKKSLVTAYGFGSKVPILSMRASADGRIRDLADYVYDNVFVGYTRKQWGLDPYELDASVTARIPVYVSYDDRYFQDEFQNMPTPGYAEMFRRMISNRNIHVELNTKVVSYSDILGNIIYTGAIDEFFNYEYGQLEYRSLEFDFQTYCVGRHQVVGQVNYPNNHDFTRTTEFAHFYGRQDDSTTVCVEYPRAYVPGKTIPYYPVPRRQNVELHACYEKLAAIEAPNIIFAGRLADYRYYNMDQAVGRALSVIDKKVMRHAIQQEPST